VNVSRKDGKWWYFDSSSPRISLVLLFTSQKGHKKIAYCQDVTEKIKEYYDQNTV
jgi:hypothetical protein